MFPSSRTANAQQHTHRNQFPSIIRTRSQQQQPLASVDLSASPLKEAIRNHNHNHHDHGLHHAELHHINADAIAPPDLKFQGSDNEDEILLSPSYKKRASSPSFTIGDHAGKRIRVLGQSSKCNSLSRRHSEESLGTPGKDSVHPPEKVLHTPKRALSIGSPSKGLVHLDLTKVPQSPNKPSSSPMKMFKITTLDGGRTMRVPVTPGRRTGISENGQRTHSGNAMAVPSPARDNTRRQETSHFGDSPAVLIEKLTPLAQSPTLQHQSTPPLPATDGRRHIPDTNPMRITSTHREFPSTPTHVHHLGSGLIFGGSPLTPLLPTPHPHSNTFPWRPALPPNTADEGAKPSVSQPGLGPSSSLDSITGLSSPTKSRIPVPSSSSISRLPRPSSSLSISSIVPTVPSPVKNPRRPAPFKHKPKVKGKSRSGVRTNAPITRLAAKRGTRESSLLGAGLHAGSSASSNVLLSALQSAGPLTSNSSVGLIPGTERKKSLVTSSHLSTENAAFSKVSSVQPPSPTKPTPLSALSTALQKLLVTPPAAPGPRPRPSTSMGFTRVSDSPAHAPVPAPAPAHGERVADGDVPKAGSSGQSYAGLRRSVTSLGQRRPSASLPKGLGKMGLPLRRPVKATINGRLSPQAGAPFASKQTSLSTVPASPAKSAAPSDASKVPDIQAEVVDVDEWVSPPGRDNGKGKATEESHNIEYIVPLAEGSESRPELQLPPGFVSPSRRASQASLSLTQSLSLPRVPTVPRPQIARSASTSSANPRTPIKTRGRTKPPAPAAAPTLDGDNSTKASDPMGGKRPNARMPGSLDVLKDCVIFVDVKTGEGEDAAALFIDMLRGLGARILAKPGKSCTHLVYKSGLPSTITRYKLLPEPRPLPVSIGWVVECVEKRKHVDETRFLVNLNEIGIAGGAQRRRSMQPKQMKTLTLGQLDSGEAADISVRAESSFTSEEPSASGFILAGLSPPPSRSPNDNLPPLERARQRSLHLPR